MKESEHPPKPRSASMELEVELGLMAPLGACGADSDVGTIGDDIGDNSLACSLRVLIKLEGGGAK
jgi:hypothetical protein